MILNIYDDGEGLSQEFSNNPNEIFQFRKTGKIMELDLDYI